MVIGVPKGLLYYKYQPFIETFFTELGSEIITSEDTNKAILDEGVNCCVDEACLPVKIYHGHVASIKDKCDILIIPRIMTLSEREFICPKFCGLPEMIVNSIQGLPRVDAPYIDAVTDESFYRSVEGTARLVTKNRGKIRKAFEKALSEQRRKGTGLGDEGYRINIALAGHPYNIYDNYINMNLVSKLHKLGVGVLTEERIPEAAINEQVKKLYKRPFWTFARNSFGFTTHAAESGIVDGIIYISSFACGIDSVVLELIKDEIGEFPMLILKVDEHTGEAGLETRVEAFVDMLERRH